MTMRSATFGGTVILVKGVETFVVSGQWFDDELVINFFDEIEWEEMDEKENTC